MSFTCLALLFVADAAEIVRRGQLEESHGGESAAEYWMQQHCTNRGNECWQSTGLTHIRLHFMCGLSGGSGLEVKDGACPSEYGCRLGTPDSVARYTLGLGISFWKKGQRGNLWARFSENGDCDPLEQVSADTVTALEDSQEKDEASEEGVKNRENVPCCPDPTSRAGVPGVPGEYEAVLGQCRDCSAPLPDQADPDWEDWEWDDEEVQTHDQALVDVGRVANGQGDLAARFVNGLSQLPAVGLHEGSLRAYMAFMQSVAQTPEIQRVGEGVSTLEDGLRALFAAEPRFIEPAEAVVKSFEELGQAPSKETPVVKPLSESGLPECDWTNGQPMEPCYEPDYSDP